LTGGIREGAKGEPPVAYFQIATPSEFTASLIFFFSSTDFLA